MCSLASLHKENFRNKIHPLQSGRSKRKIQDHKSLNFTAFRNTKIGRRIATCLPGGDCPSCHNTSRAPPASLESPQSKSSGLGPSFGGLTRREGSTKKIARRNGTSSHKTLQFAFATLSPYPCFTYLAVHQAKQEQDLGQTSHRNFPVVAAQCSAFRFGFCTVFWSCSIIDPFGHFLPKPHAPPPVLFAPADFLHGDTHHGIHPHVGIMVRRHFARPLPSWLQRKKRVWNRKRLDFRA